MNKNLSFTREESILVIDDCPENLKLLSGILSVAGYKVHLAPSGKLALTALPDVMRYNRID